MDQLLGFNESSGIEKDESATLDLPRAAIGRAGFEPTLTNAFSLPYRDYSLSVMFQTLERSSRAQIGLQA